MSTTCNLISKFAPFDDSQNRRLNRLVGELFEECSRNAKDYVNQKTIKIRTLMMVAKFLGMSWEKITDLLYTHSRIHPEVACQLCQLEPHSDSVEELLAQDFVPNDKLMRLLKRFSRNVKQLDEIMAIDGLASGIPSKRYDYKRYLDNLSYSWEADASGTVPATDVDSSLRRDHVHVVRRLYTELKKWVPETERLAPYVYMVLRECIFEVSKVELVPEDKQLSIEAMDECKALYLSCIGQEKLRELVKELGSGKVLDIAGKKESKKRSASASDEEKNGKPKRKAEPKKKADEATIVSTST